MCYAILKVFYKSGTEPALLREVSGPGELVNVIHELMEKSGVQKVISYFPRETTELVSEWKTISHRVEEDIT